MTSEIFRPVLDIWWKKSINALVFSFHTVTIKIVYWNSFLSPSQTFARLFFFLMDFVLVFSLLDDGKCWKREYVEFLWNLMFNDHGIEFMFYFNFRSSLAGASLIRIVSLLFFFWVDKYFMDAILAFHRIKY